MKQNAIILSALYHHMNNMTWTGIVISECIYMNFRILYVNTCFQIQSPELVLILVLTNWDMLYGYRIWKHVSTYSNFLKVTLGFVQFTVINLNVSTLMHNF